MTMFNFVVAKMHYIQNFQLFSNITFIYLRREKKSPMANIGNLVKSNHYFRLKGTFIYLFCGFYVSFNTVQVISRGVVLWAE